MYDVRTGQCVLPSDDGFTGTLTTFNCRVIDSVVQVEF
jgi:nitrite reductase/ring-hydroxylating ferredoxin subunit